MFYRQEFKGKGINYILKETNAKLILVNKKNLKEDREVSNDYQKIFDMIGGKFEISYLNYSYSLDDLDKPKNFIEKIKK